MATKKVKEARVEIELPDGTKISARGPMAERMARRLMGEPWPYVYPTTWFGTWFGASTNSSGIATNECTATDGSLTISSADGSVMTVGPASKV